jgi:hypothetical protein
MFSGTTISILAPLHLARVWLSRHSRGGHEVL